MKGLYRVTSTAGNKLVVRDFDAEEWSYGWGRQNDVPVLRLLHDGDPDAKDSFDFVEYSSPVSIEFVREE